MLLALPVLAGSRCRVDGVSAIAQQLGSDVPFFLLGGTAAGIGRGYGVVSASGRPRRAGVLVAPGVHVRPPEAYRGLSPRLTTELNKIK